MYNQQDATFSRSIYFYKLLYKFQAFPPPIIMSIKLYIQRQVLSNQYCCLLLPWMRWNVSSISSTITASSSIGLTIPDAVCTVLSSWWWAEETPETCRAIYRNKYIDKTLHLVGCTSEIYLRCTDIRTSDLCGLFWRSISSTIAASSSIGLTIPDAVCTVLCSWWWAEKPPETCRAIYRNK